MNSTRYGPPIVPLNVSQILTNPPPARQYLFDFLPAGIAAGLVAAGGSGKSTLIAQMALALASGIPVAGFVPRTDGPVPVAVLAAEDDSSELHRRYHAIAQWAFGHRADFGEVLASIKVRLKVIPLAGGGIAPMLTDRYEGGIQHSLWLTDLANQLQVFDVAGGLIVVDPAARFRGGSENDNEDATVFVTALDHLRKVTKTTVLVAAHTNKAANSEEGDRDVAQVIRGASALTDGLRWQINLRGVAKKEAKGKGIPAATHKDWRYLSVAKSNCGPTPAPLLLRWVSVGEIGILAPGVTEDRSSKAGDGETLKAVIQRLEMLSANGKTHSMTAFAKAYGGKDQSFGMGWHALFAVMQRAVDREELVIVDGKVTVPNSKFQSGTAKPDGTELASNDAA